MRTGIIWKNQIGGEKNRKNYRRDRSGCKSSRDFHYLSADLFLQICFCGEGPQDWPVGMQKKKKNYIYIKKGKGGVVFSGRERQFYSQSLQPLASVSPLRAGVFKAVRPGPSHIQDLW